MATNVLDLRDEAKEITFDLGPIRLDDAERAAAIDTWRQRMLQEHVSARVFAALVPQLMHAGLAARHQAAVADMIAQELHHGRLCAGVVRALGGDAVIDQPELRDVPAHEDAEPFEAVLRNVISISCLSETIAVAEFASECQVHAGSPLGALLRRILADEVRHARFGWKLLEEASPRLRADAKLRERLSEYLVAALRQQLERNVRYLELETPRQGAASVGLLDGEEAFSLVLAAMNEVVLPGLEAHGLGARDAFRAASAA